MTIFLLFRVVVQGFSYSSRYFCQAACFSSSPEFAGSQDEAQHKHNHGTKTLPRNRKHPPKRKTRHLHQHLIIQGLKTCKKVENIGAITPTSLSDSPALR
jgi:hypothetical protein